MDINGVFWFKEKSFTFTPFRLVENQRQSLRVDMGDRNLVAANQLVEALNTLSPDAKDFSAPSTLDIHQGSLGSTRSFGIILIILACLFYFGYGVYRFFVR